MAMSKEIEECCTVRTRLNDLKEQAEHYRGQKLSHPTQP